MILKELQECLLALNRLHKRRIILDVSPRQFFFHYKCNNSFISNVFIMAYWPYFRRGLVVVFLQPWSTVVKETTVRSIWVNYRPVVRWDNASSNGPQGEIQVPIFFCKLFAVRIYSSCCCLLSLFCRQCFLCCVVSYFGFTMSLICLECCK